MVFYAQTKGAYCSILLLLFLRSKNNNNQGHLKSKILTALAWRKVLYFNKYINTFIINLQFVLIINYKLIVCSQEGEGSFYIYYFCYFSLKRIFSGNFCKLKNKKNKI